jgi:Cyclic-phosphate processing Receiver domain
VTTPAEVTTLLELDDVEELSLDHDLGLSDETGREQTGYDVLQ